jgi:phage-related protein
MIIHRYETQGGKDIIKEYLDKLPANEKAVGYDIMRSIERNGLRGLENMNTRQLDGKLWEIKFYDKNRFMYIVEDGNNFFIVHACKKQKEKAEKFELDKARRRVRELEKILGRNFLK